MDSVWIAVIVLLWLAVLVLAFFLLGTLRQVAVLQLRLGTDPGALITRGGLDRGTPIPDTAVLDPSTGEFVRLRSLGPQARAITFLSPTCSACRHLIPHLNEIAQVRGAEFDFVVICRGSEDECQSLARMERIGPRMLVDVDGSGERDFEVTMTPFTYILDYLGNVLVRGVSNDWRHLESLLDQEGTLESMDEEDETVARTLPGAIPLTDGSNEQIAGSR